MERTYGRHRQSIADIQQELINIFERHPESRENEAGEPVLPANALVDVFKSFSEQCNGLPLLSEEEAEMFKTLLDGNPGLEVTPHIILQFIAEKTKVSPPMSPNDDEGWAHVSDQEQDGHGHSRNSSNETNYYQESHSRPPSRGPTTPGPGAKSPLDSERRQRSTPLINHAPSSWGGKRPTPHRRKSDAGSRSDSEQSHTSPTAYGRNSGRGRAPSNPTSPTSSSRDLSLAPGSPPYSSIVSRPDSRARSRSQNHLFNKSSGYRDDMGYSSPEDNNTNNRTIKRPVSHYGYDGYDNSFDNEVSSLSMPRSGGSDSDEENEIEEGLILDHDRSITSSTVSLEIHDRLDALQRTNVELARKLAEAEKTLQDKLAQHDQELEDYQMRVEELRSELNQSNREEKELRSKDSRNMVQIAALEAEIAKVTKTLEHARATYTSLQRQYQEQCAVSEKYRDDLRQREEMVRTLREAFALHEMETTKWGKEKETYEERISHMENELHVTMQAQAQLDEQKQENLLLKETIDRMRFDMDEMRNSATAVVNGGSSGHSSAANTMSKSLGAELAGKMNWGMDDDDEDRSMDDDLASETTAVEDDDTAGEEEEETVETIIRRKRKVASRANVVVQHREFREMKDYSDSATQYDPTLFAVSHGMQTDAEPKVLKASFSIQTDPIPEPKPLPVPPPRITVEMEIQTEDTHDGLSRSPSPHHDESMASSSSTIVPPTPKPQPKQIEVEVDEPPAYNERDQEEREWRVAAETLKKWHHGVKIPFEPVEGGVSEEAVEEWKALKQELGVECMVIDKIVASSERSVSGPSSRLPPREAKSARRGGRFYNIYNTYVYGDKSPSGSSTGIAGQALMVMGASALVILAVTPYMVPHYSIPGGATYYDRSAWHSFNSMQAAGEGFSPDGTAAVWNFLGRVSGGAARIARGWPT